MIWEGMHICHSGKTELVTVNGRLNACRYCDEIIIPVAIPVLQRGRAKQHSLPCCSFSPFTAEQHLDTRLTPACD